MFRTSQSKCWLGLAAALFLSGAVPARAETLHPSGNPLGLGVIVGEPTGITGKKWLGHRSAFDFGAAWSFGRNDAVLLYADHLWHHYDVFHVDKGAMALYYGLGGRASLRDEGQDAFGVRVPVGLAYQFENSAIGLFLEVAPVVDLAPDTDLEAMGGLGARYYFQ